MVNLELFNAKADERFEDQMSDYKFNVTGERNPIRKMHPLPGAAKRAEKFQVKELKDDHM